MDKQNKAGERTEEGRRTERERTVVLDVSITVRRYHPLFAHHTQHLCVVLVFMSELITGRCRQLPDQ